MGGHGVPPLRRAVIDAQGGALRRDAEGSPRRSGAPETAEARRGLDGDGLLAAVIAEAAGGQERAPARHGARVMVAALRLVPRGGAVAIVAGPAVVGRFVCV